jgi:hypothetical protein
VASGLRCDCIERQAKELDVCHAQEGDDSSGQTRTINGKDAE